MKRAQLPHLFGEEWGGDPLRDALHLEMWARRSGGGGSRKTPLRELAGLGKPVGKARRFPVLGTDQTISNNEGLRRMAAIADRQSEKVSLFERALGRTKSVETARRDSGLSQRGVERYRKSFFNIDRGSASPWQKVKGRWVFERERLDYTHTFYDAPERRWISAPFVGRELIQIQDWRTAFDLKNKSGLDAFEKANPGGIVSADGRTYWPETDLATIEASLRRMKPAQRRRIEEKRRYKTKGRGREE